MFVRTYIRTLFNDILKKNFLVKIFVNIYYNFRLEAVKTIKFQSNVPIEKLREKKSISFQSVTGDKIDCR